MLRNKKRKGFTIIELITVMAVLAILVLLAMPRFLNYTKDAAMAQMKNDVKVAETILEEYLINNNDKLPSDLDVIDLNEYLESSKLVDKRGFVNKLEDGVFFDITKMREIKSMKSKLPGTFVGNDKGNVYYIHTKAIGTSPEGNDSDDGDNVGNLPKEEVDDLITAGYIPVASAIELQRINDTDGLTSHVWGAGTEFEGNFVASLNSNYIQVKDIDLNVYDTWKPIGANNSKAFKGSFNGGNYTISNLKIKDYYDANGLFGNVAGDNQEFTNIKILNANIDIYDSEDYDYGSLDANAGVLIGYKNSSGLINLSNIEIKDAKVVAVKTSAGLIGESAGSVGTIKDITIEGDFYSYYNLETSEPDYNAAGLIGKIGGHGCYSGVDIDRIENVKIKGLIHGDIVAGGMIGKACGNINNIKDIELDIEMKTDIDKAIYESGPFFDTPTITHGGLIAYSSRGDIGIIDNVDAKVKINSDEDGYYYDDYYDDYMETIDGLSFSALIDTVKGNVNEIKNIKMNALIDINAGDASGLIGGIFGDLNLLDNVNIEANIRSNHSALGVMTFNYGHIGTVSNIDLNGTLVGHDNASGFAGTIISANLIDMVNINANITSSEGYAAGLISNNEGDINKISNIKIEGNMLAKMEAVGLIGVSDGSLSIDEVEILGDIKVDRPLMNYSSDNSISAGLIGTTVEGVVNISNVKVDGNISSIYHDSVGQTSAPTTASGLIGSAQSGSVIIKNVEIRGSVKAAEAGGLIGLLMSDAEISNVLIDAQIEKYVIGDPMYSASIGGVGGLIGESNASNLNLSDITIKGKVEGYFRHGAVGDGTGGIVGTSNRGFSMDNIEIKADIVGQDDTGILVGWLVFNDIISGDYSFTGNLLRVGTGPFESNEIGHIFMK